MSPRTTLVSIYKAFVRPYLDYGDVLYNQAFNNSFKYKLESIQYNTCSALKSTSKEYIKRNQLLRIWIWLPLRLMSLNFTFFIRSWKMKSLNISPAWFPQNARYTWLEISLTTLSKHKPRLFQKPFFPSTIIELKNLDPWFRKSESFSLFQTNILKFIRPSSNSVYVIVITLEEFVLLQDFVICWSHLREHKFKHSFQDTINPLCSCGYDVVCTEQFLLHCRQFVNERRTLLSTFGNFNYNLLENTSNVLTQTFVWGNVSHSSSDNSKILDTTIGFVLSIKRFDGQLFILMICFLSNRNLFLLLRPL